MQIQSHLELDKRVLAPPSAGISVVHATDQGENIMLSKRSKIDAKKTIIGGKEPPQEIHFLICPSCGTMYRPPSAAHAI